MKRTTLAFIFFAFLLIACENKDKEKATRSIISDFTENLFFFKYQEAAYFTTPESKRVLSFMATNIDEKAIETIKEMKQQPTIAIKSLKIINDTIAIAKVCVSDEIRIDSIGKAPYVNTNKSFYTFTLVYRQKGWLVKMEDLPRSEK